jgi:hypothetical protein
MTEDKQILSSKVIRLLGCYAYKSIGAIRFIRVISAILLVGAMEVVCSVEANMATVLLPSCCPSSLASKETDRALDDRKYAATSCVRDAMKSCASWTLWRSTTAPGAPHTRKIICVNFCCST